MLEHRCLMSMFTAEEPCSEPVNLTLAAPLLNGSFSLLINLIKLIFFIMIDFRLLVGFAYSHGDSGSQ